MQSGQIIFNTVFSTPPWAKSHPYSGYLSSVTQNQRAIAVEWRSYRQEARRMARERPSDVSHPVLSVGSALSQDRICLLGLALENRRVIILSQSSISSAAIPNHWCRRMYQISHWGSGPRTACSS